jgi:hypothetical protein
MRRRLYKAAEQLTQRVDPAMVAEGEHQGHPTPDRTLSWVVAPWRWSALGPWYNGRARAWAVTNGRPRFGGTAGRGPFGSSSWDNADGRFGLWSRRSGVRVPSVTQDRRSELFGHCRSRWSTSLT